ncbi:ribosome biogenesis regulatory protein-domain-containing protein [Kockovaella imperatae]|uniref:Ribosome biogenesis regulatory protein n=1 Tax=Kockovaella imperatae TaxID=4999 RepID=A0A1Y1UAT9_9TREE|nr:ribosome biogenesis regulatory protein-domain-containing protein [Kockovaella imperatae]ORX35158.1 ribosome biogenesis regulatory protein-domain-containing protein [Kockovaella imperatae]
MDVSQDLADYAAKHSSNLLARPQPADVDLGYLAAFDTTPTDAELYSSSRDSHLRDLALASVSTLLNSLFALPKTSSPLGPVVRPPAPTTVLPREKPLPKPKPPTKWERFAKEKGISHVKKDKVVWDEEKQDWVKRWGRGGKNKEAEDQWLHEVKGGDNADHDPAATARAERKARIAKNTAQQNANLASASSSKEARKAELNRSMLISKTSTASLGKFDKKIEGEPKARGVKRKFDGVVEHDWKDEKAKALDVLRGVESGEKRKVKGTAREEGAVNVRKAVRGLGRDGPGNDRGVKGKGKKGRR